MRLFKDSWNWKAFSTAVAAMACCIAYSLPAIAEDWYKPDCFPMASEKELKVVLKEGSKKIIQYKAKKPPYKFAFVNGISNK